MPVAGSIYLAVCPENRRMSSCRFTTRNAGAYRAMARAARRSISSSAGGAGRLTNGRRPDERESEKTGSRAVVSRRT